MCRRYCSLLYWLIILFSSCIAIIVFHDFYWRKSPYVRSNKRKKLLSCPVLVAKPLSGWFRGRLTHYRNRRNVLIKKPILIQIFLFSCLKRAYSCYFVQIVLLVVAMLYFTPTVIMIHAGTFPPNLTNRSEGAINFLPTLMCRPLKANFRHSATFPGTIWLRTSGSDAPPLPAVSRRHLKPAAVFFRTSLQC